MKPLIIGVDPGTTSAYAVLDSKGSVLEVYSSRTLDFNSLLERVTRLGTPIIVGCDKSNPPSVAERLASKTGAKLFTPKQDLTVGEKKSLVSVSVGNDHELDALASAVNAYNHYKDLLVRVEKAARDALPELEDELKKVVVREGVSIQQALSQSLPRPVRVREVVKKEVVVVRSEKALEKTLRELTLEQEKNRCLAGKVSELERENARLKKRLARQGFEDVVERKEEEKKGLRKALEDAKRKQRSLKRRVESLKELLELSRNGVVAKRLKRLSAAELKRVRVGRGEVLALREGVVNDKLLEALRPEAVLWKGKPCLKKGVPFLHAEDIKVLGEAEEFLVLDKDSFNEALRKKFLITELLEEYRAERVKPGRPLCE